MPLGPDERIVFEEQATPLYEEIVTSGGIDASDDAHRRARRAARGLRAARRGRPGAQERRRRARGRAVDPAAVQARVVAPLGQQGAELIAESAHWAQAFSTLSHAWRRSPERRRRAVRRDPRPGHHRQLPRLARRRRRGGAAHRAAAGPPRASSSSTRGRRARDRRPQARGEDAHALPARRPTGGRHPQVRRRGDRGGRARCARSTSSSTASSWSTGGSRSSRATRAPTRRW